MTAQTRATNTSRFEQGDQPQGTDFADLIDSFLTLIDTTAQTVTSDLRAANFITSGEVSAGTLNATNLNVTTFNATTVSGATVNADSLQATTVSGATLRGNLGIISTVSAAVADISTVSAGRAAAANLHCTVSARFTGTLFVAEATASTMWVTPGRLSLVSGDALTIVQTTAQNPVIATSANQGNILCRGFVKIMVDGTVACVPFWYSST